jgi:hypothetical protein
MSSEAITGNLCVHKIDFKHHWHRQCVPKFVTQNQGVIKQTVDNVQYYDIQGYSK